MTDSKPLTPDERAAARRGWRDAHLTDRQRGLAEARAWFVSAVYWSPGDYDRGRLVAELKRMRDLGITSVRYHTHRPEETEPGVYDFTRTDDWMDAASEAGIQVVYHLGHTPSDALLAAHGIPREAYEGAILAEPEMQVLMEACIGPEIARYRGHPALDHWHGFGEPNAGGKNLEREADRAGFAAWLRARYGTVEALDAAWNLYPVAGRPIVTSFEDACGLTEAAERRPGQTEALVQGGPFGKRLYGANRDLLRYLTEKAIARTRAWVDLAHRLDPDHPFMVGAHQLFANQPYFRWDVPTWARTGDAFGTSIHLSWHFEPVRGEVDRPVYLQARLTRDALKEGLTSAFETTGGAAQYSGGYPNAMTAGLMRRLVCSYLAAGNLALAFWTWNHRPGGWEAGEYGMTTWSGRLTPWAEVVGAAARGLEAHAEELWEADPETRVGVLTSWETDAILLQEPESHLLQDAPTFAFTGTKMQGVRARIGAGRALVNHRVPFEYVTEAEVLEGLCEAYPVIYAPHCRALSDEVVARLAAYVAAGGRLVADVQFAMLRPTGKMPPVGDGTPAERLFGAFVDMIHHTRTAEMALDDIPLDGFFGDLVVTEADVLARFADGRPAVTEHRVGRGAAVLVAFDPAWMCRAPGRDDLETWLAGLVAGDWEPGWSASGAPLAVRLAAPGADHVFLMNDGPEAVEVAVEAADRRYASAVEVLSGETVDPAKVPLKGASAAWLRLEKA